MSSQPLIANELLAFIKHAIDYMDEVSILQICKSAYKEDEVKTAKLLLFQTLGKQDQMPSRRRDGTEKSVQDIVTLMKATDPDDVPDFVVKDLHKLPPVTFDHVDVTRLLKDITFLKASLAEVQSKLEVSNNTIGELRAEVVLLRSTVSESRSPDTSKVTTRRGAKNASIGSFESASSTASPATETAGVASSSAAAVSASPSVEETTRVGTSTPTRAYAAIVTAGKSTELQNAQTSRTLQAKGDKQSRSTSNKDPEQRNPVKSDKDGFTKVVKKIKKKPVRQNQCGTAPAGPNMLLRPAIPTTQLYVSRLHHSTKVEEIVEYLRVKTNWTLRVERLESRHNTNFKSFVVRVPTHHLDMFLKQEFWPKGVVYRRFRGQLRDTCQRNTTPSIRAQ